MGNNAEEKRLLNFLMNSVDIDSELYVSGILGCGATFDDVCIKSIPNEMFDEKDKNVINTNRSSFFASPMNGLFVEGSLIEQILKLNKNFKGVEESQNIIDRHSAFIRNNQYTDRSFNIIKSDDNDSMFIRGFVLDSNKKIITCEDFGFTKDIYSYLDIFADENNFAPLVTMVKDSNGNVIFESSLHNYRNNLREEFQVSKLSKLIKIYTEWYAQFDRKFRNGNMSYENAIKFATQILMYSKYLKTIQNNALSKYSIEFNMDIAYPANGVITDYVGAAAYWTAAFNSAKSFKINNVEVFKPFEEVNNIVEYFKTYDKENISDMITDAQTIAFNSLTNKIRITQVGNNKTYIKRNNH